VQSQTPYNHLVTYQRCEKNIFSKIVLLVAHLTSVPHLSPQDAIMASKDIVGCLSYLIQLAEQPTPIYAIKHPDMSQPSSSADIPLNNNLTDDLPIAAVNTNDSSLEESMNEQKTYDPPKINKPLKNTNHPRTLKEFANSGSAPVQCNNSKQREPLHISVRNCLNWKTNILIAFRFLLMMKICYTSG
jgi:hypothetical protein